MAPNKILKFKGTWRSYQERILNNLDAHLLDNKLHIVAAPGAGKTTLGIEVIARLNRTALILCPTNTIKEQWRDRICSSFLTEEDYGIVSTNIREPRFLTISTYQALLSAFCGITVKEECVSEEENEELEGNGNDSISASARFSKTKAEEFIRTLKEKGVSLLCFDEAHHLRNEWWKALDYLNTHLKPAQTLALTATPPYDVDQKEWKRYQDLCGEIDEIISIPELVSNGDLCPHQDFIYFSSLRKEERQLIENHTKNINTIIKQLKDDDKLLNFLHGMPFLNVDEMEVEKIFDNTQFYVSIVALLHSQGYPIPKGFLDLFDASENNLPPFDVNIASAFLNGFLFSIDEEEFQDVKDKRKEYLHIARKCGLIVNNRVVLSENKKMQRQLARSLGKLDSIVDIVRIESKQLSQNLRMVILTDYIRIDDTSCTSLGVVPVWKVLNDNFGEKIPIGILCGSLILLPLSTIGKLQDLLSCSQIAKDSITFGRFKDFDGYVKITAKEGVKDQIVRILTELFNIGNIRVIIGTQALLGEGWDAPSINSLILSSTVCSYMLSNQMRGRAIRIDRNNPQKVSNIWHLATVDEPTLPEKLSIDDEPFEANKIYLYDLLQLSTRFNGYEAPSYYGNHTIESGIERIMEEPQSGLNLNTSEQKESLRNKINRVRNLTLNIAQDRAQTRLWWSQTSDYDTNRLLRLSTGINTDKPTIRTLCYTKYKYIIASWLSIVLFVGTVFLRIPSKFALYIFIASVLMAGFFITRAIIRFLQTGTPTRIMRQIAFVILESLSHQGLVKTSLQQVGVTVKDEGDGRVFVTCSNLTASENNLFIQCLKELLNPIENPRYLLVRHDTYKGMVQQTDYFSVPEILTKNKKSVAVFGLLWEKYIGKDEIVCTRTLEGRKLLLKARNAASSASKRKRTKQMSKWI